MEKPRKALLGQLLDKTDEVRKEYLFQTEVWANKKWAEMEENANWLPYEWYNKYEVNYVITLDKSQIWLYGGSTKEYHEVKRAMELNYKILKAGKDLFLIQSKKSAELKYKNNILKLVDRLKKFYLFNNL